MTRESHPAQGLPPRRARARLHPRRSGGQDQPADAVQPCGVAGGGLLGAARRASRPRHRPDTDRPGPFRADHAAVRTRGRGARSPGRHQGAAPRTSAHRRRQCPSRRADHGRPAPRSPGAHLPPVDRQFGRGDAPGPRWRGRCRRHRQGRSRCADPRGRNQARPVDPVRAARRRRAGPSPHPARRSGGTGDGPARTGLVHPRDLRARRRGRRHPSRSGDGGPDPRGRARRWPPDSALVPCSRASSGRSGVFTRPRSSTRISPSRSMPSVSPRVATRRSSTRS